MKGRSIVDAAAAARTFVDAKARGRPRRASSRSAAARSSSRASRLVGRRRTAVLSGLAVDGSAGHRALRRDRRGREGAARSSAARPRDHRAHRRPRRLERRLARSSRRRRTQGRCVHLSDRHRERRLRSRRAQDARKETAARITVPARARSCRRCTRRSRPSSTARGGSATTRPPGPATASHLRVTVPGVGATEQTVRCRSRSGRRRTFRPRASCRRWSTRRSARSSSRCSSAASSSAATRSCWPGSAAAG